MTIHCRMQPGSCLFFIVLLGVSVAGRAEEPSRQEAVRTVMLPLPVGKSRYYCWEPHVAADPDNPARILVAANFIGGSGEGKKYRPDDSVLVWRSDDAGRSFSGPTSPLGSDTLSRVRRQGDSVVGVCLPK
jgi:hypothetical protein